MAAYVPDGNGSDGDRMTMHTAQTNDDPDRMSMGELDFMEDDDVYSKKGKKK